MSLGLNYHGVGCGLVLHSLFNPAISHKSNDCFPCQKNNCRLWHVNKMKGKFTWSELTMMGSLRIIQVTHSSQGGVVTDPWYVQ